jgi:serine/threonine protein kinase
LAEARFDVSEAVRLSSLLAEALRSLHDQGRLHLALSPENVELSNSDLALLHGPPVPDYAAPEGALDARSDIFSFGVIVFEMFLGRRPRGAESTGSPAVDRVVLPCLAADPAARPPRMQRVILELRMLKMAARRAAAASAARNLEARLTARLDAQERAIAELHAHPIAGERPSGPQPQSADVAFPLVSRVTAIEQTLDAMKKHTYEFERSVAADLLDVEETLRRHTAAMDATRDQITRTDDVVERLVKVLEALQRAVVDHDESADSATVIN